MEADSRHVLGRELSPVVDHPGASPGAALAAGIGTGALEGWASVERFVRLGDPVAPRLDLARDYDDA